MQDTLRNPALAPVASSCLRKWPGDEGGTQKKAADEDKGPVKGRQEQRQSLEAAAGQRMEGGVHFIDFAVSGRIGLVVICYSCSFLIPLCVFFSIKWK